MITEGGRGSFPGFEALRLPGPDFPATDPHPGHEPLIAYENTAREQVLKRVGVTAP